MGCGGFSTVHLGTLKNDSQNTKIAVKITESSLNEFMLEISAMCKLSHQNILPILGYNLENKIILTEYMENGSLHDVCCFKVFTWNINTYWLFLYSNYYLLHLITFRMCPQRIICTSTFLK